jgi:fatty acid amide hydrolase
MTVNDPAIGESRPADRSVRHLPAAEIVRLITTGDLSSADVVEAFIARVSEVDEKLNAVTVDLFQSARATARKIDEARLRGESLGPLAGLPVTIKDCFDLAGTASTFGLTTRRDIIETQDDPYVAALRAAGAIPIAKTNVPQLLIYTESDNPLYGRTNNPWDLERSCGGSSGGEAALIAAGASPLGLGNDIGGSLRTPSAFCGITAIRPTAGRTPDRCGHGLPVGQRAIVSQVGPMARRVEDLTLALRLLDGARDPAIDPGAALEDPAAVDISRLRFATFVDDGEFPAAPAARRAVDEAAQILTDAGAAPTPWRMPTLSRATDLIFACLSADRGTGFKRLLQGNKIDPRVRSLLLTAGAPVWLRAIAGVALGALGQSRAASTMRRMASGTADHYWQTVEAMVAFRQELLHSFVTAEGGAIDLVLCPAYAVPAQRHGASLLMPLPGAYAALANVSGFPAGVVPITRVRATEESDRPQSRDQVDKVARETERGSAGLPIAVQVIARPWRDHVALAAMAKIEAEAMKRPDYPAEPPL